MRLKIGDIVMSHNGTLSPWYVVYRLAGEDDNRVHARGKCGNAFVPASYLQRAAMTFGGPIRCDTP